MENKVIELIAIIGNKIGSIIYVDGKTEISIEEFLRNNSQIKILAEFDYDYEFYKPINKAFCFNETKFNIVYATKKYIL